MPFYELTYTMLNIHTLNRLREKKMEKEDEGSAGATYIGTNIENQENNYNNCVVLNEGANSTIHIHFDADKQNDFVRSVKEEADGSLPHDLQSNRAKGIMNVAVKEGLLDDSWQPTTEIAEWQLAVLAHRIGEELEIQKVWQAFGKLWNRKPNNLKAIYYRYLDTDAEHKFRKKLNAIH